MKKLQLNVVKPDALDPLERFGLSTPDPNATSFDAIVRSLLEGAEEVESDLATESWEEQRTFQLASPVLVRSGVKIDHVGIVPDCPKDRVIVRTIASSGEPARDNKYLHLEGIDWAGWDGNAVVPWCHQYDMPTVGRGLWRATYKRSGGGYELWQDIEFMPRDLYPFGNMVGRMYAGGWLKGFSSGWLPITVRQITKNSKVIGLAFVQSDYLETSACPIPIDKYALAEAVQARVMTSDDREMFAKFARWPSLSRGVAYELTTRAFIENPKDETEEQALERRAVRSQLPALGVETRMLRPKETRQLVDEKTIREIEDEDTALDRPKQQTRAVENSGGVPADPPADPVDPPAGDPPAEGDKPTEGDAPEQRAMKPVVRGIVSEALDAAYDDLRAAVCALCEPLDSMRYLISDFYYQGRSMGEQLLGRDVLASDEREALRAPTAALIAEGMEEMKRALEEAPTEAVWGYEFRGVDAEEWMEQRGVSLRDGAQLLDQDGLVTAPIRSGADFVKQGKAISLKRVTVERGVSMLVGELTTEARATEYKPDDPTNPYSAQQMILRHVSRVENQVGKITSAIQALRDGIGVEAAGGSDAGVGEGVSGTDASTVVTPMAEGAALLGLRSASSVDGWLEQAAETRIGKVLNSKNQAKVREALTMLRDVLLSTGEQDGEDDDKEQEGEEAAGATDPGEEGENEPVAATAAVPTPVRLRLRKPLGDGSPVQRRALSFTPVAPASTEDRMAALKERATERATTREQELASQTQARVDQLRGRFDSRTARRPGQDDVNGQAPVTRKVATPAPPIERRMAEAPAQLGGNSGIRMPKRSLSDAHKADVLGRVEALRKRQAERAGKEPVAS